jgi:hypothetical protein
MVARNRSQQSIALAGEPARKQRSEQIADAVIFIPAKQQKA